jgi:uncharacterized membrane protein
MLVPIPIACFAGCLLTDIVYWRSAEMMWSNFSAWLVSAGVVAGFLAGLVGAVDFLGKPAIRNTPPAWFHVLGNLVVLGVATVNMLVHTRDGWTSVVPWGLALSALTVLLLLFTGWMGWSMVYRHHVGVEEWER